MALFSLTNGCLAYGHLPLLDRVDFSLVAGERVGLIGRNGAGKSSLLKIVAGLVILDDGQLVRQSGLTTAYVPQEPELNGNHTIFSAVSEGLQQLQTWLEEYTEKNDVLAQTTDEERASKLLREIAVLQTQLDMHQGWTWQNQVQQTLEQLQLDPNIQVETLSGGMKKRVALARALVAKPDILILDEPTNHLDYSAIIALEELLIGLPTAVLLVTHDRAFLDRVVTRIVELDRGQLLSYPGNFAAYQVQKGQQLAVEAVVQAKFDKFLAQEEVWIRKGVEARRTRNEGRVKRLEALRQERIKRRGQLGRVQLEVDAGARSGKLVAELINVNKGFSLDLEPGTTTTLIEEGRVRSLIQDFSATILRGDKVGLIGPNGVGKTTLLRLILGEIAPDGGSIKHGTQLQIAYFDQMREQLDLEARLVDTISPGSEWIQIGEKRVHVMTYLADFLFAPERARSPIKSLSGGERNRLLLARLFANPANLLVLDEPTNDLDIDTLELLEDLLQNYTGTVLLVSHDRAFLDAVVTQTIAYEGAGKWREYIGGFTDWQRQRGVGSLQTTSATASKTKVVSGAIGEQAHVAAKLPQEQGLANRTAKLSYKEQRELEVLPSQISTWEVEQKSLQTKMADSAFYKSDSDQIKVINLRYQELETLILQGLERWEYLESKGKNIH